MDREVDQAGKPGAAHENTATADSDRTDAVDDADDSDVQDGGVDGEPEPSSEDIESELFSSTREAGIAFGPLDDG
jgi:hypothetical protein